MRRASEKVSMMHQNTSEHKGQTRKGYKWLQSFKIRKWRRWSGASY
jgi:hypothetical protein